MNSAYLEIATKIHSKVKQLNSAYKSEKEVNLLQQEEIKLLKKENAELKEQNSVLIKEINSLKLSLSLNQGSDNEIARDELDKLIRELDLCITLINRM